MKKQKQQYYVYIITLSTGHFYIGATRNINLRMAYHFDDAVSHIKTVRCTHKKNIKCKKLYLTIANLLNDKVGSTRILYSLKYHMTYRVFKKYDNVEDAKAKEDYLLKKHQSNSLILNKRFTSGFNHTRRR